MIERFEQMSALVQFAETIKADCIQSLEDIAIFPVHGRSPMLFSKLLNLFEARDDSLLARRLAGSAFRLHLDAELVEKRVILIRIVTHEWPPPSCGQGRQPLRPSASPRRPAM